MDKSWDRLRDVVMVMVKDDDDDDDDDDDNNNNNNNNKYIQMQKSVILGTCSIVRNFLNYK